MNRIIKKIIDKNKQDLLERKEEKPLQRLKKEILELPEALDFYNAFEEFGIIAEIKFRSPSVGEIAKKEDVFNIAQEYQKGGASAISVITEKYFFDGDIKFIKRIKEEVDLPILMKDFITDEYQIFEAREAGADALLLIAKMIDEKRLREFTKICLEIGIEPVVEINDEEDLEKSLNLQTRIIAVNARDLNNFEVDIDRASELIRKIPDNYLKLAFSGVASKKESDFYKKAGARGVLVGTKLMMSKNKKEFLEGLR